MRSTLRTHLVLGRVSNLPTVWSNCLAGWIISAPFVPDVFAQSFPIVLLSMTLLYIGGMYLNDAADAAHDVQTGKSRPIVLGQISQMSVFIFAGLFLTAGAAVLWAEGWKPFAAGALLALLIILYNFVHNLTEWSPFLIAACRMMIYPIAALAAAGEIGAPVLIWAPALGGYIVGLSYVAKSEDTNRLKRFAPLVLLLIPPFLNLRASVNPSSVALSLIFAAWLAYCLFFIFSQRHVFLKKAVGGMLAGICLVDLLAVSHVDDPFLWQALTLMLFLLSLFFQRFVPAT